jgi:hypothetical protein
MSDKQRKELFTETAARRGIGNVAIVEKDFWVCWSLSKIFEHKQLSKVLLFKGGTSLSKVFKVIERFSEDIDLVLDWRELTDQDPLTMPSRKSQKKLIEKIYEEAARYILNSIFKVVCEEVGDICKVEIDGADAHTINIYYPVSCPDITAYLKPAIRLEIGPRSGWSPNDIYEIISYSAEEFPRVFKQKSCKVVAIKAERTFWEKVAILHKQAFSTKESSPDRYSRHYYDLARMAQSAIKSKAFQDRAIFSDVIKFTEIFFPSSQARYDLAKIGTVKLIPNNIMLKDLKKDYKAMEQYIFGEYPDFKKIVFSLKKLEDQINRLK